MTYRKDFIVFPIVLPIVAVLVIALNNDPLFLLVRKSGFWMELLIGTTVETVIWFLIRTITIRLDKHTRWEASFGKRLILQVVIGWIAPSALLLLLCSVTFNYILGISLFDSLFPYYEYPFAVLILALFNVYYMVAGLLHPQKAQVMHSEKKEVLFAFRGADVFPIVPDSIRAIHKSKPHNCIYVENGEKRYTNQTLELLEKSLSHPSFFRINRQIIMHFETIASFRSIENGKLEITPAFPFPEKVIVSQKKAAQFKKWIDSRVTPQ